MEPAYVGHICEIFEFNIQVTAGGYVVKNTLQADSGDSERIAGVEVKFPVIADLDFKVSKDYGLIHEAASDTAAVRAVFAIDPQNRIRAIIYYPMQLGRNVDELIRLFQGLKVIDSHKVSVPVNWQPGEPVVVPPPGTVGDAAKRAEGGEEGLTVKASYLATTELNI